MTDVKVWRPVGIVANSRRLRGGSRVLSVLVLPEASLLQDTLANHSPVLEWVPVQAAACLLHTPESVSS